MIVAIDPEPEQSASTLWVGQDRAGHWLVQESGGRMEGRFISRDAAMRFACAERHGFPGARVAIARGPLAPAIPFDPIEPEDHVLPRAR